MLQGVPVRIEVGPRDVEQGTCVAARRDQPGKEGKQFGIPLDPQGFVGAVQQMLDEVQVCRLSSYPVCKAIARSTKFEDFRL